MSIIRRFIGLSVLLALYVSVQAQRFYNLTADEVRIDSVLPFFSCSLPLPDDYQDSVYTVTLEYPEFIRMSDTDIDCYRRISSDSLPGMPIVSQQVVIDRKKASLEVSFCPLVYRTGRYQILVSFMLNVKAKAKSRSLRKAAAKSRASSAADRYAAHSVLSSGRWVKIRVPETGVYQLTDALVRQAGFTDPSKVKVYGYGGALQPEVLDTAYLRETDDLSEVPTYTVNGRRLFRANGPVSWKDVKGVTTRVRNYCSDYGYYFLTESDEAPLSVVDSASFVGSFYPSAAYKNTLYEKDGYAWYHGGRNLVDETAIQPGTTATYSLPSRNTSSVTLYVAVSSNEQASVEVGMNGTPLDTIVISSMGSQYVKGKVSKTRKTVPESQEGTTNSITLKNIGANPVRLDYIQLSWQEAGEAPRLSSQSFPVPEYVYEITNQDLHGSSACDMVIIIPTSQKLLAQAQRLADFHHTHDGLRVNIVPADELYNEFSSGTPDVSAYRRYLKMLYDRAGKDTTDMPRFLLLFGDCVWDNRMLTTDCRQLNADDYLLCFESEESYSETDSYVNDGFFCLLDHGEGGSLLSSEKQDLAVGRFPVTTVEEAATIVDKVIGYKQNTNAGPWQNTIMFMGDDGNRDIHMIGINKTADDIANSYPGYHIKKVMWDAYTRETSSTGNTYPEVAQIIKQQQNNGALIMNYGGHGSEIQISHEAVLRITDFAAFNNANLPLWITASCDIMPFDGVTENIGETALLNTKGGAVAFFGTTRTVYEKYNNMIDSAFMRHVLSQPKGVPMTLGEAQRLAKNELDSSQELRLNNLQYSLLGDPAMSLNLPTLQLVIDSINGETDGSVWLKAGSVARISGHVVDAPTFKGVVSMVVRDTEETVVCKHNDKGSEMSETPFTFRDRLKTLYSGTDSIVNGRFSMTFAVPKDINYADDTGMINLFAWSEDHSTTAHGYYDEFWIGGSDLAANDSIGPSIYCYLNSPSFVNGGSVNSTPYFVAEIADADGINAAGNGVGHDLELIIDGEMSKTYNLNDHFTFDFGTYTRGSTWYSIPELSVGAHKLLFRAWDVLNNSSVAELRFNVVKGMQPNVFSISCTQNPAYTTTTFVVSHDRVGSPVDVDIEVFDMTGRLLWRHEENNVTTTGAYTTDWDLTVDGGQRLQTGVYLYRARVSSDGSSKVSKAKKLIII